MILVVAAHPDDEVLGCGGTIAQYAKQGKEVVSLIFSDGDPLNDSKKYITERRKESINAGKVLGISQVLFLGLPDNPFGPDLKKDTTFKKVENIIVKLKPKEIFTHCSDDPHPAHRSVAQLVQKVVKSNKLHAKVYAFKIGNPLKIKHRDSPRLYIDISKTMNLKRKAMKEFHSQKKYMWYYSILAIINNKIEGAHSGHKYAEVFHKESHEN
jgi:N-acetylglucosamine malate deacetylase 1